MLLIPPWPHISSTTGNNKLRKESKDLKNYVKDLKNIIETLMGNLKHVEEEFKKASRHHHLSLSQN